MMIPLPHVRVEFGGRKHLVEDAPAIVTVLISNCRTNTHTPVTAVFRPPHALSVPGTVRAALKSAVAMVLLLLSEQLRLA
jgi:hypothetical protein